MADVAVYPIEYQPVHDGDHDVTPHAASRSTDINVTQLQVPLPYMVTIIGICIAIAAGIWRVDSRITIMEANEINRLKVEEANKRADDVLYDNMKNSVDDLKRQTQLLQLQYVELSKQITQRK